ncbi:uncharacterized protein BP01DRAFT_359085 [Aspergillus saccharolyticus JOP 1030-1]|uniref:Uncharacterized protein n=1 Tax=Aspergillus saccharolyticus JOP 1030-1 TaxID=1450539 RepID=A0A318Z8Y6_9EURO|nr:hypothetical protein BP01DRAFT_359085 [Aspergillus saccharolyticus JOP 1030-1]PYH42847.1 hypothetical protein BP01DRAFT_359085 [Aspergillus saccharolyticus JOP 1030-1]
MPRLISPRQLESPSGHSFTLRHAAAVKSWPVRGCGDCEKNAGKAARCCVIHCILAFVFPPVGYQSVLHENLDIPYHPPGEQMIGVQWWPPTMQLS